MPLEAGWLLKCSQCGEWHTVRRADGNVGKSEQGLAMRYWLCCGGRFYAGQRGSTPRCPIRNPRPEDVLVRLGPELSAPGWSEHHY